MDLLLLHDIISTPEWEDKTSNFQYLSAARARWDDVEESRKGEGTGMRRVIDGANESQRMMGGRVKGHVHECCGSRSECNEVRQKRCVQTRRTRWRVRSIGKVRGLWEARKTRSNRETDSAELNVSIQTGSWCNPPVPTHWYQKVKCVSACWW